jgi:hypothetical protein
MKLGDLTLIQILGIILIVNGALTGSLNEMTDLLGAGLAKHIVSICTIGSSVCGGLVTMFGGQSTQVRNVMAMPGVESIKVNGQANQALSRLAVDPDEPKIEATLAAKATVSATATGA